MMISLTRLNGSVFWLACEHIEFVESTPDTIISLVSGKKVVVKESPGEVLEKVIAYRSRIWDGSVRSVEKQGKDSGDENADVY